MPVILFKSNNERGAAPASDHPFVRNRNMMIYGSETPPEPPKPKKKTYFEMNAAERKLYREEKKLRETTPPQPPITDTETVEVKAEAVSNLIDEIEVIEVD